MVSLKDGLTVWRQSQKKDWCLVMTQIQFSLIIKIKIGRPEHLLTLTPISHNILFLPYSFPQPHKREAATGEFL